MGGLNWYRNLDRHWEMNVALSGAKISQPSLFVASENDMVVRDTYTGAFNALEETMPRLTKKVPLPRTGHWVQQARPAEVTGLMLDFLLHTSRSDERAVSRPP
jgi:pimeloyl-ACP methyl ester carboxylesterase